MQFPVANSSLVKSMKSRLYSSQFFCGGISSGNFSNLSLVNSFSVTLVSPSIFLLDFQIQHLIWNTETECTQ